MSQKQKSSDDRVTLSAKLEKKMGPHQLEVLPTTGQINSILKYSTKLVLYETQSSITTNMDNILYNFVRSTGLSHPILAMLIY